LKWLRVRDFEVVGCWGGRVKSRGSGCEGGGETVRDVEDGGRGLSLEAFGWGSRKRVRVVKCIGGQAMLGLAEV
jgi:hypothetical protein